MASIRFTGFFLGLVFLLIAVRDSIAYSHQALEEMPVSEVNPPRVTGGVSPTLDKEIFDNGVPAAEVESTSLGGRKITVRRALGKEMVKKEGADGVASKISGAAHFVGKYKHKGEGFLDVESKFSNRGLHPAVKVKMAGFIAFNADYHVPRPHPPKNN